MEDEALANNSQFNRLEGLTRNKPELKSSIQDVQNTPYPQR